MKLSPHFSLAELTVTTRRDTGDADADGDTGETIANVPDAAAVKALTLLAVQVLEPVRLALGGHGLKVTSGYRSRALNIAIKGAKNSEHCRGEAADVIPLGGLGIEDAFRKVAALVRAGAIPVDQAIVYAKGGFMHLSIALGPAAPKREVLRSLAAGGSGGPYVPYAPESSR